MAKQMEEAANDDEEDYDYDDYYAEPIEYDEENSSPLIRAILQKNLVLVNTLLQDKLELNPRGWDNQVPLVAAVHIEDISIVQTLIAAGANPDLRDMSVEASPLSVAIRKNHLELVQLLLEQGASPEGTDSSWTALVLAIPQDSLPMVQLLLEAGADPNANMEDCDRAIMHAASH